ncbi:MAG: hypothetical protein J6A83_09950 [Clostridia bacterium]|nr:hypothetical protein [Clostridia bacterium]
MSLFKTKNSIASFEYQGFEGIDRGSPAGGGGGATDILNYRILSDGSLQKRREYRYLSGFSEPVRAFLSGETNGSFAAYALAGNKLYSVDMSSGEQTEIAEVGTSEGGASLFFYMNRLYIADGADIYMLGDSGIVPVMGYVPLLGDNWGSTYPGKINEPLNTLNPRARITYTVTDENSIFLSTLYKPFALDRLYHNGEEVAPEDYLLDERLCTISMAGLKIGDRLEAHLIFDRPVTERERVVTNTQACVFGGISNSRVFMWNGEKKNLMFCTRVTTAESLRESVRIYGDNGDLYFPLDYEFTVGDGRYGISTVGRHLDRLLIFTEGETWMADSDSCGVEDFPVMRINTDNGCRVRYGVARCGNDPVNVGREHIMRLTSNTDELEDCNAYVISHGIAELLPKGFFENASVYEDKRHGEVLFSGGENGDGRVFVYGNGGKSWYIYDNIPARLFFEAPDGLGFLSKDKLYIFDDSLSEDIGEDGEARKISAYYEGQLLDFGYPFESKRLMRSDLRADTEGENVKISLVSDKGIGESALISGERGISSHSIRMNCGRFTDLKMRISSSADAAQRIYALTLTVKK